MAGLGLVQRRASRSYRRGSPRSQREEVLATLEKGVHHRSFERLGKSCMGTTFCPDAVVWGDVATWVSAVATFAAVIVALVTSHRALVAEHRAREAERQRAQAEDDALAQRLAAVFDHELFMCATQLRVFADGLQTFITQEDAAATMRALTTGLPSEVLTILSASTDKLRVFDAATATALMQVVSTWNSLAARPSAALLADVPVPYLLAGAGSVLTSTRGVVRLANAARTAIRPVALTVNPRSPPV